MKGNGHLPGLGQDAARGLSCTVGIQGQTAIIEFRIATPSDVAPDGRIAVALPTSGLPGLRAAVHRAMDMADRSRGWYPRAFSVGHPEHQRGHVAVTFEEPPIEMTFLLRDDAAKKLAEAIMADIIGRGDAAERARLQSGVLMPTRKIILPGR